MIRFSGKLMRMDKSKTHSVVIIEDDERIRNHLIEAVKAHDALCLQAAVGTVAEARTTLKKIPRAAESQRLKRSSFSQLGEGDLLIEWKKPTRNRRSSCSKEDWEGLPETLALRQIKVTVKQPEFRVSSFYIITTLLDAKLI